MSSSNTSLYPIVSGYWRKHKKTKYWSLHGFKAGFAQSAHKVTYTGPESKILYLPFCLKGRGRESSLLGSKLCFLHFFGLQDEHR